MRNRILGIMLLIGAMTLATFSPTNAADQDDVILFTDQFDNMETGVLLTYVGAYAEYHFMDAIKPKGPWAVSTFNSYVPSQRAWRINAGDGKHVMKQTFTIRKKKHTHAILVAGDPLWGDYQMEVTFAPQESSLQSGVIFRYQNDRQYYFFGVDRQQAILKMVDHAKSYHKPYEVILDKKECLWTPGEKLTATITVSGDKITARLSNGVELSAEDNTFSHGKIALMADIPTDYYSVTVTSSPEERDRIAAQNLELYEQEQAAIAKNPKPVVWRKMTTEEFGVMRNLRFGDLDNDGDIDVLIPQVKHHGPKNAMAEVGAMTAMTFDGEILWQKGNDDEWNTRLMNDVGVQIHDVNNDGKNEVIYAKNFELVVADAATGEVLKKTSTPLSRDVPEKYDKFDRILGDAIFFCDISGNGYDGDIVIKDRQWNFWVLNGDLEILWDGYSDKQLGHYPYAEDIDDDGRDELAIGYSLYDDNGKKLWSLDGKVEDHPDGLAAVDFDLDPSTPMRIFYAASDEGMIFTDLQGNVEEHYYIGHVQNPAVANFRSDLPGLETVSINFWGNQGIINFYDSSGRIYHTFEPVQHGSMMLPINWNGTGEEYFVLSANPEYGGMYDGWGKRVFKFPDDGHPDMCNAVLDITGDSRDEIVVWDPYDIWVYSQDDNPRKGRLYDPVRNPLYNYSNYQTSVSYPGWSE